jgi:tetratricopeptide (TPR) repeat protein
MNDLRNPYIAGAPVVETSMFFGREEVFNWLENSLSGKFINHILVIHGQRRVGKTTVLKQIPNFLSQKYIQVFLDLQGRTNTTLDRFLWWIASEIVRTLQTKENIALNRPERDSFEDPERFITDFIPMLLQEVKDHSLLLTFDEFDSLAQPDIQNTLTLPFINFLPRIFDTERLNFIFSIGSSGNKLENMQASYTNFFKTALYRKITFLSKDECQSLITKPVEGVISYQPEAIKKIITITSGHPYFTQLTCHELFSKCQASGARLVTSEDVDDIVDNVVERGTVNLKFIWDEASDLERWILAALAQDSQISNNEIAQKLKDQGVLFSESDLNSAILHLRDKDVLTKDNRFIVYLLKRWLRINRPMERVREELVQTNPIADRYLEIGDKYRERGQIQEAIESYQHVLSIQGKHEKALLNIGTIYFEQKNYQAATSFFDKALQVDNENIAALQGYCQAQLAQGKIAEQNGVFDEAIDYYQSILNINPVHTETRQRLAHIYLQKAEAQTASGSDQGAIDNLRLALEMTPDDEKLNIRLQQTINQKKTNLIESLLEKADKAYKHKRWEEAASYAQQALNVDPEDEALQNRVAQIKDAPRQEMVQAYRHEAEQAIENDNFAKAIIALQNAITLDPNNATLREWLKSLQEDQQEIKLNNYQSQAEQAESAGDWEKVIATRKAALMLNPENEALRKALSDAQETYRQSRLQELLNQAESAQNNQQWDKAIQSAKSILDLDPNNKKAKSMLDSLTILKQQARLKGLLTQAKDAAATEQWQDAAQAWEAYIEEVPEEAEKFEDKIKKARFYAQLSADYNVALTLMNKRKYEKAIEKFQGIVAQDPTYKSSSRLLVEAVEASKKRKPFWQSKGFIFGAIGVVIILLAVIFNRQILGLFSQKSDETPVSSLATQDTVTTSTNDTLPTPETTTALGNLPGEDLSGTITKTTSEFTQTLTLTLPPTSTIMISRPLDLNENILAYIGSETPTFTDDFSSSLEDWGDVTSPDDPDQQIPLSNFRTEDGLQPPPNLFFPQNEIFSANDFVLTTKLTNLTPDDSEDVVWTYHLYTNEEETEYYSLELTNQSDWEIFLKDAATDEKVSIDSGEIENESLYELKIVCFENNLWFYINDDLLTAIPDAIQHNLAVNSKFALEDQGNQRFAFTQFEFWNLEDVDLDATPEADIEFTATRTLAQSTQIRTSPPTATTRPPSTRTSEPQKTPTPTWTPQPTNTTAPPTNTVQPTPSVCNLYIKNSTGEVMYYEVFGTGIGQKTIAAGDKIYYGSFPAGSFSYYVSGVCGAHSGYRNFPAGDYTLDYVCN